MSGIIIASNRLPIAVADQNGSIKVKRSDGGLATALGSVFNQLDAKWVGCLGGISTPEIVAAAMAERYYPVTVPENVYNNYYINFSNRVLWPILHGLIPYAEPAKSWDDYVATNAMFADSIAAMARPDDLIWIHDYQLMLVPRMLRQLGVSNRVGFFLHTPFNHPLFFTDTVYGQELLASLQTADVLGVQTKQSLSVIMSAIEQSKIRSKARYSFGHTPAVKAFPIGIDYASFARKMPRQPVFHEALGGKEKLKTLLSLSRLDYTKGLIQQLLAIKELATDSALVGKFVLRLAVVPSREAVPEYIELKSQIEQLVTDINSSVRPLGWQPIIYEYDYLSSDELIATYREADVMLVTPVADGMNLIAKEYVAANPSGTLVLSSGAGAAEQLSEALLVNPDDITGMAAIIKHALQVPASPLRARRLRQIVRQQDVHHWAQDFLKALASNATPTLAKS